MFKVNFLFLYFITQLACANEFISNYCDQYFFSYENAKNVQPILNVDKVYRKIHEWEKLKFKDEILVKKIGESEGQDILRLDLPSKNPTAKRILITAGLHGNEPFGVTALLEFIERTVSDLNLRNEFEFVFIPMINPKALKNSTRLNSEGIDLNRTFSRTTQIPLSKTVMNSLQNETFAMAIDLHGSIIREGFFIIRSIESNENLAKAALRNIPNELILKSNQSIYPEIIPSVKDPTKAAYELLSPGIATSFNKGTLKDYFSTELNIKNSFTFEYPGQINVFERQNEYVKIIQNIVNELKKIE
jgi:hypothetical protein